MESLVHEQMIYLGYQVFILDFEMFREQRS